MSSLTIATSTPMLAPSSSPTDGSSDASTTTLSPAGLMSFCDGALSNLDASISSCMAEAQNGDATAMLQLEQLVGNRQLVVSLTSNMIASIEQSMLSTVQNIGRG